MSYLHIENLYKNQTILLFRECWALEKVHGTSANVAWRDKSVWFSSGGASPTLFAALFDKDALAAAFEKVGHPEITIYGEAYGGSQQKMKHVYGDTLRFIVFDIKIGDVWLKVLDMAQLASQIGFEVVPFEKVPTELEKLDEIANRPSEVAKRRGTGDTHVREGVVLRPLIEVRMNNDERVIAKHKTTAFAERANPPKVVDSAQLAVLEKAEAIAQEWVTPMRLDHVLQKIEGPHDLKLIPVVVRAMIEDVRREARGEIVESREAEKAIGKRTAQLFKDRVSNAFREVAD